MGSCTSKGQIKPTSQIDPLCQVFWDIQNCSLNNRDVTSIVSLLRSHIQSHGFSNPEDIWVFYNPDSPAQYSLSARVRRLLVESGATLVDVASNKPQAADLVMIERIHKFIDYFSHGQVVLVSGDADFCGILRRLQSKRIPAMVYHNKVARKSFIKNANQYFCWEDTIVEQAEEDKYEIKPPKNKKMPQTKKNDGKQESESEGAGKEKGEEEKETKAVESGSSIEDMKVVNEKEGKLAGKQERESEGAGKEKWVKKKGTEEKETKTMESGSSIEDMKVVNEKEGKLAEKQEKRKKARPRKQRWEKKQGAEEKEAKAVESGSSIEDMKVVNEKEGKLAVSVVISTFEEINGKDVQIKLDENKSIYVDTQKETNVSSPKTKSEQEEKEQEDFSVINNKKQKKRRRTQKRERRDLENPVNQPTS